MYHKTILDNGLRVLTVPVPRVHSVAVGAFIGSGARHEEDSLAGASHFLEHLLFKGTRGMPTAKSISETIEGVGGLLNASTGQESTTLWCKVARPHFRLALQVMSEMLLWPLLDAQEMEKERQVILEELRMANDYPSSRVGVLIDGALWPNHPLGREVAGTRESIQAVTRDQLLAFHQCQYGPTSVVLSVAGDIAHEEVVREVTRSMAEWQPREPLPWHPFEDTPGGDRFVTESRDTDQVHMCIALPGLPAEHPDRRALDMMNVALGEGMSSRLFTELRERRGLAYDVHSGVSYLRDCGALVVYCGVEPRKALQAARLIVEELDKLKEGLPSVELDKVKSMACGRLLLYMEDTRNLAMWVGSQELLRGRVKTLEDVLAEVASVSDEDVRKVANQLIRRDKLRIALVGPAQDGQDFRALLDS